MRRNFELHQNELGLRVRACYGDIILIRFICLLHSWPVRMEVVACGRVSPFRRQRIRFRIPLERHHAAPEQTPAKAR
jgi:hypothetical protein